MSNKEPVALQRFPSGIPGLDEILHGGFLKGGVYIVKGTPGAGKTILANQICFNHVATRGCALFVTLLAESHSRMLQHLQSMDFYDENAIPERLYYLSGFGILESDGLKGIVDLLRREIKARKTRLLVLDGFSITEASASSEREFKKFVHDIQSHAAATECTVLLLTNGSNRAISPEYTMVDGVIELEDTLFQQRTERTLQVRKLRGSDFLAGRHPFRITPQGFQVFPRIEAMFGTPSRADDYQPRRMSTAVHGLDAMLKGGIFAATTTGLFGPTGSGKTTLALQFLSRSTEQEPGLFVGFFESPERLRVRAESLGIDLRGMEARGIIEIIWRPQGEHLLDELGQLIIDATRRRSVKRLCIDGYGGLLESAVFPERITRYVSALANELRALGAATIINIESTEILGSTMELPSQGMSSLLEGLIILRYAEIDGKIQRLISITKIRDSDFDPFVHACEITPRGIEIGGTFSGIEAILSGHARAPKAAGYHEDPEKRTEAEP